MFLLLGISMALTVHPEYLETKDSGNQNLDTMDVAITIDCDSKTLTVTAEANDTGQPIPNSNIYLFYTDYEYQLIANGNTGSTGTGTINVLGNRNYLTAMFVLRVDNPQFRSREVEFTYEKCFETQPEPPPQEETPPEEQAPPPEQNETPSVNQTQPEQPPEPAVNETLSEDNDTSQPIVPPPQQAEDKPCIPAFILSLLTVLAIVRR